MSIRVSPFGSEVLETSKEDPHKKRHTDQTQAQLFCQNTMFTGVYVVMRDFNLDLESELKSIVKILDIKPLEKPEDGYVNKMPIFRHWRKLPNLQAFY